MQNLFPRTAGISWNILTDIMKKRNKNKGKILCETVCFSAFMEQIPPAGLRRASGTQNAIFLSASCASCRRLFSHRKFKGISYERKNRRCSCSVCKILIKMMFQKKSGSFKRTVLFSSSETGSTYVNLFCSTVDFNGNMFDIRLPHSVASSMRMAHIVSEMSTLITNCTSSHVSTSL